MLGLGWVGLGWVGLGWVGLGWVGLGWVGLGWVGLGWINLHSYVIYFIFSRKIKCTTHGGVAAIIKVVCFHTQSSSRVPQRRNMSRQLHSTIRRRSMHGLASGETTALIVLKTKISKSQTKLFKNVV